MPLSPEERASRLLVGLLLIVLAGVYAVGFYLYATGDNTEFIDGQVADTASTACTHLDARLRALPPVGPTTPNEVKAERAQDEARLIQQLVSEVQKLGHKPLADDHPAEQWLRDWDSLAQARLFYAQQLRLGVKNASMREPQTSDHYPISRRMKDAGPDSCAVVDRLRRSL